MLDRVKQYRLSRPMAGVAVAVVAVGVIGGGTAVAKPLITGKDIKAGSISGGHIKNGSLHLADFDENHAADLKGANGAAGAKGATGATGASGATGAAGLQGAKGDSGATGAAGTDGATGAQGAKGIQGDKGFKGDQGDAGLDGAIGAAGAKGADGKDATYVGKDWSIVDRNVIGNGDSYLRAGPDKSRGDGSLGIRTGGANDAAAFGNQVDFAGVRIDALTAVGFSVFSPAENTDGKNGHAPANTPNMPSIAFEIDPNVEAVTSNYSTLVFMPNNTPASKWTAVDATISGFWGLTGSKFAGTKCDINGSRCTFQEIQDYLNDGGDPAVITYSVQITKGRDYAFSGAVDALVVGAKTYDFEPFGVYTTTP